MQRTFTTSFRGYSEAEVRAFLKRVSEELVVTRDREAELLGAIDALEEQLRAPRPLNEPEMLDALGAETTRLLAVGPRGRRRDPDQGRRARRARCSTRRAPRPTASRAEAEELVASAHRGSRGARRRAREPTPKRARPRSEPATERTRKSSGSAPSARPRSTIEAARQQGREMLDEAKATRERVLADLVPPPQPAAGPDRRAARRARQPARRVPRREALVPRSDRRARAGRSARRRRARRARQTTATASRRAGRRAARGDRCTTSSSRRRRPASRRSRRDGPRPTPTRATPTDPSLADVDSLFARLRAGQAEATVEPAAGAGAPRPPRPASRSRRPRRAGRGRPDAPSRNRRRRRSPRPRPATGEAGCRRPTSGGRGGPTCSTRCIVSIAKRAKRAAQDDQNALLDAVRRHKGRPTAAQVLVPESELLRGLGGRAARRDRRGLRRRACRRSAASRAAPTTRWSREAAATIVMPVRERIAAAIDTGEEGDTSGLVERIGARFREWKNQSLEEVARRRAGGGVVARRLRRLARRRGVALDPAGRGPLRRLRRQRPGADGEGFVVPHRSAAPARASRVPLLAGARRHITSARCGSPRFKSVVVRSAFAAG